MVLVNYNYSEQQKNTYFFANWMVIGVFNQLWGADFESVDHLSPSRRVFDQTRTIAKREQFWLILFSGTISYLLFLDILKSKVYKKRFYFVGSIKYFKTFEYTILSIHYKVSSV